MACEAEGAAEHVERAAAAATGTERGWERPPPRTPPPSRAPQRGPATALALPHAPDPRPKSACGPRCGAGDQRVAAPWRAAAVVLCGSSWPPMGGGHQRRGAHPGTLLIDESALLWMPSPRSGVPKTRVEDAAACD